jgi:hypothetical protein
MASASGRTTSSTSSGDWESYHMADEHFHITNFVLNNFIKMVNFLENFCWLDENSGRLDIG